MLVWDPFFRTTWSGSLDYIYLFILRVLRDLGAHRAPQGKTCGFKEEDQVQTTSLGPVCRPGCVTQISPVRKTTGFSGEKHFGNSEPRR